MENSKRHDTGSCAFAVPLNCHPRDRLKCNSRSICCATYCATMLTHVINHVFLSTLTSYSSRFTLSTSKSTLSMRLLSTNADGSFSLTSFTGNNIPSYAILSHTWGADQELTFQDVTNGSGRDKAGYRKIQFCRDQAKKDGLQYFWVDSCCIDKSNSVEVSQDINSMFRLYRNAAKCYVYLSDFSARNYDIRHFWEPAFRRS